MDTTFYQFGVEYLRWTHNGTEFTAVKEQVEILGKDCFEADVEYFCDKLDLYRPDAITYEPI